MSLLPGRGPARTLAFATLINTVGNGAFLAVSVLYLTRSVGLSALNVGLGLGIAGIAGIVVGVPAGRLADVRGARVIAVALSVLAGLAALAFVFVSSFATFVVVAAAFALFDRGAYAARQALIAGVLDGDQLVRTRAYLRAVTNVGFSLGAGLAALALQIDTRAAYQAVLVLDALTFVLCGLVMLRLPDVARTPARAVGEPRLGALRDRPYLALTVVNAVMLLHIPLIEVVLPLWVTRYTDAPRILVAGLIIVNTVTVVLMQVRVSRGVDDIRTAVRAMRLAGFVLAASCVLFAGSSADGAVLAVVMLLAAAVLHALGEMVQSSGAWVLAYELAPKQHMGQYQGLFNSGMSVTTTLAPSLLVLLVIQGGPWGWLILGAVFLGAQFLVPPVVAWAERSKVLTQPH